ncbi:MAG: hypothetical protein HY851_01650 [candidate division Zixibacteria bacterium]|nr:hypothetical protein [candidate division Zixibacteria bacterium]
MLLYELLRFRRAGLVVAAVACLMTTGNAQTPVLEIQVSNEYYTPPLSGGTITVYVTNYTDSIAGFNLWLQLDRPDVIEFIPTTGVHLQVDPAGTLTADWGLVDAHSKSGTPYDAGVVGVADTFSYTGGSFFGPSSTARPLFRLPFVFKPRADTLPDPVANVVISGSSSFLSFARPDGSTVDGIVGPYGWVDTTKIKLRHGKVMVVCKGDADVNTDGMVLSVADMVELIKIYNGMAPIREYLWHADLNADCVIDSLDIKVFECLFKWGFGCLPYPWPPTTCCNPQIKLCCAGVVGNVDCDPSDQVDISDLSALIDHLFISLKPLCCLGEANIDGANMIDISDLTGLIDNLYITATPFTRPACAQ